MRILILGGSGLVGKALCNHLKESYEISAPSHESLDLTSQPQVNEYFTQHQYDIVINAAGKVGGIEANRKNQSTFLYENTMIQVNTLNACLDKNIKLFINLGSACIYPKDVAQPIEEQSLLSSALEPANEGYAIAKITGLKYAEFLRKEKKLNCITLLPCNLFGPEIIENVENAHAITAIMYKVIEAYRNDCKKLILWGTGTPRREFLHVKDLSFAVEKILRQDYACLPNYINIGSGEEVSIATLASSIAKAVGYKGLIEFDNTKPDGVSRRFLRTGFMDAINWHPRKNLNNRIDETVKFYTDIL